MSSSFFVDPWAGSGDLGLGEGLYLQDIIGPQSDGTYSYPVAAQPVNDPANTAGYSASAPAWVGGVLTQGIATLGQYLQAKNITDYRRWEATNGGLFMQGRPAYLRNGQPAVALPSSVITLLLLGGLLLLATR